MDGLNYYQMNSELDLFHNTTALIGDDLERNKFQAGRLNKRVLTFFRTHSYENYTPFEVYKALGINSCIKSSVQRSISDLTDMRYLDKMDGNNGRPKIQRPGQFKERCFCWRLA
jgi:hypothetical protein